MFFIALLLKALYSFAFHKVYRRANPQGPGTTVQSIQPQYEVSCSVLKQYSASFSSANDLCTHVQDTGI